MTACRVVRAVFAAMDEGDRPAARARLADDFAHRSRSVVAGTERVQTIGPDEWLDAVAPLRAAFSEQDHGLVCRDEGDGRCTGTFNIRARHTGVLSLPRRGVELQPTGRVVALPPEPFVAQVEGEVMTLLDVVHPPGGGIAGVLDQLEG